METGTVLTARDCSVLIVDDEENLCKMLKEYFASSYRIIDIALSVEDARIAVAAKNYDVIVTDLRLDDGLGTDILQFAKEQDPFVEVIIITGYGTLESASLSMSLGATAYLSKPLKLTDLAAQVSKAAANRLFHLKSLQLIANHSSESDREHIFNITTLYRFTSKLMLTLEVRELMQIVLREINDRFQSKMAYAAVNYLGYLHVFAMAEEGIVPLSEISPRVAKEWDGQYSIEGGISFLKSGIEIEILSGREGEFKSITKGTKNPVTAPLSVLGDLLGFIAYVPSDDDAGDVEERHFFDVMSTLVSSAIQHAYLNMQAREQAKTDSLTSVANHRMFQETLDREIARCRRHKKVFSIVMMDIDDFKKINDSYGHVVGDSVLIDITRRISTLIRKSDLLARYGGEEFVLILTDTPNQGAMQLAERIRVEIEGKPHHFSECSFPYTVSIGVATFDPEAAYRKSEFIDKADKALYIAKNSGKNRVVDGSN